MQYKKLTRDERGTLGWQKRRNALVGKILAENPLMRRSVGLKKANKIMHLRAQQKHSKGGYEARNARLAKMGYENYHEYLKSDDWRVLRNERLQAEPCCCMCSKPATQVHHFSYEEEVLLGLIQELLFSVCEDCHHLIEFDGLEKRTLRAAQQNLIAFFAIHDQPMADRIQEAFRKIGQSRKASRKKKPRKAPKSR